MYLLLSRNIDDQLSSNFHRFIILCICWDTPSEKTGLWQLPIVSSVFKDSTSLYKKKVMKLINVLHYPYEEITPLEANVSPAKPKCIQSIQRDVINRIETFRSCISGTPGGFTTQHITVNAECRVQHLFEIDIQPLYRFAKYKRWGHVWKNLHSFRPQLKSKSLIKSNPWSKLWAFIERSNTGYHSAYKKQYKKWINEDTKGRSVGPIAINYWAGKF